MASAIRCQRGHKHDDHKMLICDLPVGKVEVPSDGCRFGLKLALVARGVTGKGEERLCSTAMELLDEFCIGIVARVASVVSMSWSRSIRSRRGRVNAERWLAASMTAWRVVSGVFWEFFRVFGMGLRPGARHGLFLSEKGGEPFRGIEISQEAME